MDRLGPILVTGLFRELSRHLVSLLSELDDDEWHQPTSSSERMVKDIAAHLLDGNIRRLSWQRDGYSSPGGRKRFDSHRGLMDYLNRLNSDWTTALRRVSPQLLVGWLEQTDRELADFFETLDPFGPAIFAVAWAGEDASQNWFDVAREYTEKWHHQQQIYDALARPSPILDRKFYFPCLDIFMRALPFTFRRQAADEGTLVRVEVRGDAGGSWFVIRDKGAWIQRAESDRTPAATFSISQDSAWKLFTKRIDREIALARFSDIKIDGDVELASCLLDMVSVMA